MKQAARVMTLFALGGIALQGLLPMEASAATSAKGAPTVITMMGQSSIQADHVVAADPWSGKPTSWVPVYYLQRVLKFVGVQSTWDGNTMNATSIPRGWTVNAASAPQTGTPPTGEMQFSIGGNTNGFVRSPKLVAKDPAGDVDTTYIPVYYADLFLHERLAMGAVWTGTAWILSPQPVITQTTYSDSVAAGKQVQTILRENTYLVFDPESQTVNLGPGITAKEDGALSHAGLQWHEGNWTVEVLWFGVNQGGEQLARNVVEYLHTHMLPVPKNTGTIIISSVDWTSSTLQSETTIAWQEDNVMSQLETLESPLQALQTVVGSNNS